MPKTNLQIYLLSDLYQILSAPRRCYVIQLIVKGNQDRYTVRELSKRIAAIEQGIPKENATGEPYRNVYNALSQTHLQTMADFDIIDYDPNRQFVRPNQRLRLAELIIECNHVIYFTLREITTNK